jgi:hypothetical protein
MTLALRDEFTRTCLSVGREVEKTVTEHIKAAIEGPLTDEQLQEAFKPLIKFIEEDVEIRIRQEIEDVKAAAKEAKSEREDEDLVESIRGAIRNVVVLFVNGKRKASMATHEAKRLKTTLEKEPKVPELKNLTIEYKEAPAKIDQLPEDNIHRYFPYSDYWEKYCPILAIQVDKPANQLIHGDVNSLVTYIEKSSISIVTLLDLSRLLERLQGSLSTIGSVNEIVLLLKSLNGLWNRPSILPSELGHFLEEMDGTSPNSLRDFLWLSKGFLKKQKAKSEEESASEDSVAEEKPDVPEKQETPVSVTPKRECTGTCAAYDCFTSVYADSPQCGYPMCEEVICIECHNMGRYCEDDNRAIND